MSYLFDDASSQYLSGNAVVASTSAGGGVYNLSMAAWIKSDTNTPTNQVAVANGDASDSSGFEIRVRDPAESDVIGYWKDDAGDGGDAAFSQSDTTWSTNTWHHIGAEWILTGGGGAAAYAYLDGDPGAAQVANLVHPNVTISTDDLYIGRGMLVSDYYFSGRIAEVALWSNTLSDADWLMLALGVSPLKVRPDILAFYAPLRDNATDYISGQTLTVNAGASLDADHPRIIQPSVSGLVTETGFRITSVSSDDVVLPTEDPWNIAGRGFGAR